MRVELDLISCRDNGECAISAPQIFHMDSEGKQSLRKGAVTDSVVFEVPEGFFHEIEEAKIVCPMQAISILEGK
jgi:ferredoxin